MRPLAAILLSFLLSSLGHATGSISGKFEVGSFSACNGRPVVNGDLSTCVNFSYWNRVRLRDLASIDFLIEGNEKRIRLADKNGNVWQQDLSQCIQPDNAREGCSHDITFVSPSDVSIKISQWGLGRPTIRLRLKIKDEKTVTLSGVNSDFFQFQIRKIGPSENSGFWNTFRGSCVPNHCYSMMGCNGGRWPSSFKSSCDSSYESYCNYRGECERL